MTSILPFPLQRNPHTRLQLENQETVITFPFSKAECAVINAHLRERSPEICDDIADPKVSEIVERFIAYVWRECETAAPMLAKSAGWFYLIAVSHIHSWGYLSALLGTVFCPGAA